MRQSGRRLAEVAAVLREHVRPGVTTIELDQVAEREIRARGGVPSFLKYQPSDAFSPFPGTICASPNHVVVHGIPSSLVLAEGDIISVDVGMIYGGYHSDHAFTVAVGVVSAAIQKLLDETERSLYKGIAQARAGNRIGDIGHAIERALRPHGFGIVRDYVGHGIGRALHERPSVPNFGKAHRGPLLSAGMCLAIEPMVTLGREATKVLADGWTVVTRDGTLAAHFEHTIAVTPKGPEILTALDAPPS